jgi:hypothetical protein
MLSDDHTVIVDKPPYKQLPKEVDVPSSKRRILVDIIGTVIVVILFNIFAIWFLSEYSTNFGYFLIQHKWRLLDNLREPVEWLYLGDSSCNQGVIPSLVNEVTGEIGPNLCTIGNMTALEDLWMLEFYIDEFGPPENVLIIHVYDMWYRNFTPGMLGQIPLPWGFWDDFSFASELVQSNRVKFNIFLEAYVPLYSQSSTLGSIIYDSVTQFKNPFVKQWHLDPYGFLPEEEAHPDTVERDAQNHIQFVTQNDFFLSYNNKVAMDKMVDLAEKHGINIYIANSPQYEGLFEDENYQRYFNKVRSMLIGYAEQSERVYYISEVKVFPAIKMQNADHLITSSANEYTNWLIDNVLNIRR